MEGAVFAYGFCLIVICLFAATGLPTVASAEAGDRFYGGHEVMAELS